MTPKVAPKFKAAMSVIPSPQLSCIIIANDRNLPVVVAFRRGLVANNLNRETSSLKTNTMPREDIAENSPLGISTLFRGLGGLGNVRYDQACINTVGSLSDQHCTVGLEFCEQACRILGFRAGILTVRISMLRTMAIGSTARYSCSSLDCLISLKSYRNSTDLGCYAV